MFDRERKLYDFMLGYCKLLTRDIDDARMADSPAPGVNHPAWILTHLALATDYAARLLGEQPKCPEAWHKKCGPGSKLSPNRGDYASKQELLAALEAGHARVNAAAARVTEEALNRPHSVEIPILKQLLPTVGELLAHLMTTHAGIHLGQLSLWRRTMGLPSVLPI
jgi:hypothetical protein